MKQTGGHWGSGGLTGGHWGSGGLTGEHWGFGGVTGRHWGSSASSGAVGMLGRIILEGRCRLPVIPFLREGLQGVAWQQWTWCLGKSS